MFTTRFHSFFFIAIFLLFNASCSSISNTNKSISTDVLVGEWLHSHEEDAAKEIVFRPNDYNFPPARGSREKMVLKESGILLYATNGPNDQPVRYEGTWQLSGKQLVLKYDSKQLKYTVVDISTSILKLK